MNCPACGAYNAADRAACRWCSRAMPTAAGVPATATSPTATPHTREPATAAQLTERPALAAELVWQTAFFLQLVIAEWLVFLLTRSPLNMGLLAAAYFLPALVAARALGWCRRLRGRPPEALAPTGLALAASLLLCVLTANGRIVVAPLLLLALLTGAARGVHLESRAGAAAAERTFPTAALLSSSAAGGGYLAFLLSGPVVSAWGLAAGFGSSLLLFGAHLGWTAYSSSQVRADSPGSPSAPDLSGLAKIFSSPSSLIAVLPSMAVELGASMLILFGAWLTNYLGMSASALFGIGLVGVVGVAAAGAVRLSHARLTPNLLHAAVAGAGVALFLMPKIPSVGATGLLLAVFAFCAGLVIFHETPSMDLDVEGEAQTALRPLLAIGISGEALLLGIITMGTGVSVALGLAGGLLVVAAIAGAALTSQPEGRSIPGFR